MELFSVDAIVFSKKFHFFDPENIKKCPKKLLFFLYWPGCPNGPKTEIPYPQKPLNAGLGIQTGDIPKSLISILCNTPYQNIVKLLVQQDFNMLTQLDQKCQKKGKSKKVWTKLVNPQAPLQQFCIVELTYERFAKAKLC